LSILIILKNQSSKGRLVEKSQYILGAYPGIKKLNVPGTPTRARSSRRRRRNVLLKYNDHKSYGFVLLDAYPTIDLRLPHEITVKPVALAWN
jgi:hypothetical protein